jgi:hypothetical protein
VNPPTEGVPSFYPNHMKPTFTKMYVFLQMMVKILLWPQSHRAFTSSEISSKRRGLSMVIGIHEKHDAKENVLKVYMDRLTGLSSKGVLPFVSINSNIALTW